MALQDKLLVVIHISAVQIVRDSYRIITLLGI